MQFRITKCLSGKGSDHDFSDSIRDRKKPAATLMARLGESVVRHSLELQAKWIDIWIHQFEHDAVDLLGFSEQVRRMNRAMHDWSGIQEELWKFWFDLLDSSLRKTDESHSNREKLDIWKKVIKESEADLNHWFTKWEEQIHCKPLVPETLNRLVEKLGQEMLGWIQNQSVLWQYGFDFVNGVSADGSDRKPDSAELEEFPPDRDNLTEISGIGPLIEQLLNAQNIVTFRQIADLSDEELSYLENNVLRFPAKILRKEWIQEARDLCARDRSESLPDRIPEV
ncbi:MAG: hypothetical protein L0Y38_04880 [Methylococcaceae bacterium]|nr:hypothetical protein [Methylococcaceae bacterium]